jgi:hypothetical protein
MVNAISVMVAPIIFERIIKGIISVSFLIRATFHGRGGIAIGHHYDFLKTPNVVTQASGHTRSDSQRLVDSGEVVVYRVDRKHALVILNSLAEISN